MMFCPYCGSKIANDDIAFYAEDSKTARIETVTDAVIKIFGTKEQREEEARRNRDEARKSLPYLMLMLLILLILALVLFFLPLFLLNV